MISLAEENYLKAIFHLSRGGDGPVTTNELAESMRTKAASATDMIKRLAAKSLISYEKYHGVELTNHGKAEALSIVRKHRLWETFLVKKLGFTWDEVHDVAEQLEHIQSPLLTEKLDAYLGHPTADPHGHTIPDKNGKMKEPKQLPLSESIKGMSATVTSVRNSTSAFLQYLDKVGISIGTEILVEDKVAFDGSMAIVVDRKKKITLSKETSENILVGK
jgi:DtxR family transcriptional regulator, Mn-dependent transcriptional regulator